MLYVPTSINKRLPTSINIGIINLAATFSSCLSRVSALTQVICYQTRVVASCNLLPVRMQAGATYDEAAQHDNTTGID
jgi:hypothetical protein